MHIWNMKVLAGELRNNRLSEAQTFRYLFVLVLFGSAGWASAWVFGISPALVTIPFGFVFPIVCLGIILIGLRACFRSFQTRNGAQFIPTLICLLLPANVRMTALYLPLAVIAALISLAFPVEERQSAMVIANAAVVTCLMAALFVLLHRHLADRTGAASETGHASV